MSEMNNRDWRDTPCIKWPGRLNRGGYGVLAMGGKRYRMHRLFWEAAYGPIPEGLFVCHRCDNPACCNPSHLFLGTNTDNVADRQAKGRSHRWNGKRRGEANPRVRLTEGQVKMIRDQLSAGRQHKEIAEDFDVSRSTISMISSGAIWSYGNG